ncbi:hypothetical protein V8C35DRAFT_307343 [Trichoderma chlorosporum]
MGISKVFCFCFFSPCSVLCLLFSVQKKKKTGKKAGGQSGLLWGEEDPAQPVSGELQPWSPCHPICSWLVL